MQEVVRGVQKLSLAAFAELAKLALFFSDGASGQLALAALSGPREKLGRYRR